jgi:hypothetical protein
MDNKKHFSDRDNILRRTFKMFVAKGVYKDEEYHDFCRWAKDKAESFMVSHLTKIGKD